MNWRGTYQQRLMTAEVAIKKIAANSRVFFGHAAGEPTHLVEALIEHRSWFSGLEIVHMVSLGKNRYCETGMEPYFHHNSLFVSKGTRQAVAEGRAEFTPCYFYQVPQLIQSTLKPDVALISVTPPDQNGQVSLGVSCDYTYSAVKQASLVIAQVNAQMPWTYGKTVLDVADIDCFVEHDEPLLESAAVTIGDVEQRIGENCASLIQDGDTLQLGIGAIPDAVLFSLKDKRDLGIHSEMISDGIVELMETGVITNRKKSFHPGVAVVSFIMGSKRLYQYIDKNPLVELYPVDYVNHPMIIAKNNHMVSINSCVQIDLMGQVCSETIGLTQISAVGGQVDFIRGAAFCEQGKSILAISSTTGKGAISKIVPLLDQGAAVTTSRLDVDYVVTEYGIAKLKGKTLRERARLLISIAHPAFRDDLTKVYRQRYE